MGRGLQFTADEVAKLMQVASAPAAGRTLEERVAEAVAALQDLVPHSSAFVHWHPQGWQLGPPRILYSSLREAAGRDYVAHYFRTDPMAASIAEARGEVVCLSDFVSERKLDAIEFSELLRQDGVRRIAGLTLVPERAGGHLAISLHRRDRARDFTPRERFVLELMAQAFGRLVTEQGPREAALDRLGLTETQRRVVSLAARGLGDREIARELGVKFSTVRTHLKRLYAKLGVQNRTELAALVLTAGRE